MLRRLSPALPCVALLSCARPSLVTEETSSTEGSGTETTTDSDDTGTDDDGEFCPPWDEKSGPTGLGDVEVSFTDVTVAAGLDYRYFPDTWPPDCDPDGNDTVKPPCKMQVQAGGAAVGDFDDDGWPDIYATRLADRGLLFRNLGDGTFAEVGLEVGLDLVFNGNGAAWADLDGDEDLDLYVTSLDDAADSRFFAFINEDGVFTEDAQARGLALENGHPHWGMSVGVGDYDLDGWLDLFTTEWWPGADPTEQTVHVRLLRNRGGEAPGFFDDVTAQAGVSMFNQNPAGVYAFSPAFVDFDENGWPELAVTSDLGTSRLFLNRGDGTFSDITFPAGVGIENNGMGSTFGDLDGDGHLDWYVTAIHGVNEDCGDIPCSDGGNRFYRSLGPRCFEEVAMEWGINDGHWGWGTVAFDFDNDGDLDLAETNGFRVPHGKPGTKFADHPNKLWRNDGPAKFEEIAAQVGIEDPRDGRGLMSLDYDRDGDLDLFIVATDGPRLYRNDGGDANGWLEVEVRGSTSNRHGHGVHVRLRRLADSPVLVRQLGVNAHFLAQEEPVAHFGLGPGDAAVAEVEVRFPASGEVVVLEDVEPRQRLIVNEPD